MSVGLRPALVILLHGVGSQGRDLAGLAAHWAKALPDVAFEAPDAPELFHAGSAGRQWFSVDGVTDVNRPARIVAARVAFDRTLATVVAAHGLTQNIDRVALVGFSQGAIMALDAVASGRWPVGAVVALSGRLASPEPLSPATGTPVLLVHGSADPVIPAHCMDDAAQALGAAGMAVTARMLPGVGHTIDPQGAALAADFLAEHLIGA